MADYAHHLRGPAPGRPGDEPVVVFEDVRLAFDDNLVLDGISFKLYPGFTKIFLGASGSGTLDATVTFVRDLGATVETFLSANDTTFVSVASPRERTAVALRDTVGVSQSAASCLVFAA